MGEQAGWERPGFLIAAIASLQQARRAREDGWADLQRLRRIEPGLASRSPHGPSSGRRLERCRRGCTGGAAGQVAQTVLRAPSTSSAKPAQASAIIVVSPSVGLHAMAKPATLGPTRAPAPQAIPIVA